jgi:hypothetical protein
MPTCSIFSLYYGSYQKEEPTPRRRRENNIKMILREIGWDSIGWIHLVKHRDQRRALVNTVMNFLVA